MDNQEIFLNEIRQIKRQMRALQNRLDILEADVSASGARPEFAPGVSIPEERSSEAETRACPKCGTRVPSFDRFCMACGFEISPLHERTKTTEPQFADAGKIHFAQTPEAPPKLQNEKPGITPPATAVTERKVSREAEIGTKWFGMIGIVFVVSAFAFFVKIAIDNEWIGPVTRIAGGVGLGALFVALGVWLNRSKVYKGYDAILIGGGFALTYFSIYAAYHFYSQFIGISQQADLALLTVVVAAAIAFSLRLDSAILAGEAFLLGYVTAYLCGLVTTFTLLYNIVLAAGLVFLVYRKGWFKLGVIGIAATYIIHIAWMGSNPRAFNENIFFLACYFALFVALGFAQRAYISGESGSKAAAKTLPPETRYLIYAVSIVSFIVPLFQQPYENMFLLYFMGMDIALMAIACEYSLAGMGVGVTISNYLIFMLWNDANTGHTGNGLGFLIFLYSLFSLYSFLLPRLAIKIPYEEVFVALLNSFLFFGFLFHKIFNDYREYAGLFTLGMAAVSLALAATASFKRHNALFQTYLTLAVVFATLVVPIQLTGNWLPVSWAVEAAVLTYLSISFGNPTLRWLARAVSLIAVAALARNIGLPGVRSAALIVTAVSFFACAAASRRSEEDAAKIETTLENCLYSLVACAAVCAFLWISISSPALKIAAVCAWGIVLLAVSLPMSLSWLFVSGLFAHGVAVAFSFYLIAQGGEGIHLKVLAPPIASFYACSIYMLFSETAQSKEGTRYSGYAYSGAATLLLTILLAFLLKAHWLSIAWGVEAVAILIAGVALKSKYVRYGGIALFALTLAKVLALDMKDLELGFRVISLFGVGVLLLAASFLYYRFRENIEKYL